MIPEHRVRAERGPQRAQMIGDDLRLDESSALHALNDEVAEEQHEVGPALVDHPDDAIELMEIDARGADVEIGYESDPDGVRGPARKVQHGLFQYQSPWLPPERPDGNCQRGHRRSGEKAQQPAAPRRRRSDRCSRRLVHAQFSLNMKITLWPCNFCLARGFVRQ